MSIFSDIASAIFGSGDAKASENQATPAASPAPATSAGKPATGTGKVDVLAVLDKMDETSKEDLDWRVSIVDLMKLLKLDSSLKARKALADELGYTGDKKDSAAMNMWLHKQVMTKLAENGGVVPKDLQH